MRTCHEPNVVEWVNDIRTSIGVTQRRDLHYRNLSPTRKIAVTSMISKLPLRGFAICSNKKNMRQHSNRNAAKIPSQQWFYNWCVRLLLERVTTFCDERTFRDYGDRKLIKIEFSRRGGHRYSQTKAYHYYLKLQQEGDSLYLKKRQPVTKMLNTDLMQDYPHQSRAGLQLADVVGSAFYQAIDALGPSTWFTTPAKTLQPIMAKENGIQKDFGVALFPTPAWKGNLTSEQQEIFEAYGYDFERR